MRFRFLFTFLLLSTGLFAQTNKAIQLSAPNFKQQLDTAVSKNIIDVRTAEEFATGHITDAKNINVNDKNFAASVAVLDKTKPIYVYCKGGLRSADATTKLQELGFTQVYDLKGGIMAWTNNEFPLNASVISTDNYTINQFDSLIKNNQKVLIDFYADWCLPCKKMEPGLRKLEKDYQGKIVVIRINVEEAKALSKKLNLEELPVLTTYYKGQKLKRVTGFQTDAMMKALVIELNKKN